MKINAAAEQLARIAALLKPLYVKLYTHESCNTKHNAQRNLAGRTHYVDDDMLRFHKSRITASDERANGLLFQITTSDALDMCNTKRGFRTTVFDVFGTVVYCLDLDEAKSTSAAAEKACARAEFDIVGHYRKVFAERLARAEDEASKLRNAMQDIAFIANALCDAA